jgi:hypothetical protein
MHSLSSSDDTASPASTSVMKLPAGDKLSGDQDDIASAAAIVPAPAPGILQVWSSLCRPSNFRANG